MAETTRTHRMLPRPLARMRGISLIELMIAMVLGLVISGAVAAMYLRVSLGRAELDRLALLAEGARHATDQIVDDLRHAGYYGPSVPGTTTTFTESLPCNPAWNAQGWNLASTPPVAPVALQGLSDPVALPAGWTCLPEALPGFDALTLRRVSETEVLPASITTNQVPYLQASRCTTDVAPAVYSANPGDFTLRNLRCEPAAAAPVPVRQFMTRTYYVSRCNECNPSDGIATLKLVEYRDGGFSTRALAEGVVGLQFEYGFDTDGDGNVDLFQSALNGTAGDPGNDWSNVVSVRLHLLLQSIEPVSGPATTRRFDLGPGHAGVACPDGRRCVLSSTSVRLTNVASRRERP